MVLIHTPVLILSCSKACWYPISNIHLCLITGIQFLNCYYNFLRNSNCSDHRLQRFTWYQVICLFQVDKTKWVNLFLSFCCIIICWRQNMLSKQRLPSRKSCPFFWHLCFYHILCFVFCYFTKYSFNIIYNT